MTAHVWAQKSGTASKLHATVIDLFDGGSDRADNIFEDLLSDWKQPAQRRDVDYPDQIDPDIRVIMPRSKMSATTFGNRQDRIRVPAVDREETSTFLSDCIPDRGNTDLSAAVQPFFVDVPLKQPVSATRRRLKSLWPFITGSIVFHFVIVAIAGFHFGQPDQALQEGGAVIAVVMLGNGDTDANAGTEMPVLVAEAKLSETQDHPEPAHEEIGIPVDATHLSEARPLAPSLAKPVLPPAKAELPAETARDGAKPYEPDPVPEQAVSKIEEPAVLTHQLATEADPVLATENDYAAKRSPPATTPVLAQEKAAVPAPPDVAKAPPAFRRDPALVDTGPLSNIPPTAARKSTLDAAPPVPTEEPKPKSGEKPVQTKLTSGGKGDKSKKKSQTFKTGNAKTETRKGSADGTETASRAGETSTAKGMQAEGNADTSNYPGKVRSKLKKAWKATRDGSKGSIVISFTVSASGDVSDIAVGGGKISDTVRKAAEAAVRRAAPFPPIPAAAGRSVWRFEIPIVLN